MKTFHKFEIIDGRRKRAVFEIPTSRGYQYLCVYNDIDSYSVVEIEAELLLNLWRENINNVQRDIAHGSPKSWVNDRKFKDAEIGFLEGEKNPVPLPRISCGILNEYEDAWERHFVFFHKYLGKHIRRVPFVSIDDVTRSIWLMTYGAQRFPVLCSSDYDHVKLLHLLAGDPDVPPQTVKDIFNKTYTLCQARGGLHTRVK